MVANSIIRIAGKQLTPEHFDPRDIDNIRRRVLNIEKSRRELRWTPEVSLEEGLRSTYNWLLGEAAK